MCHSSYQHCTLNTLLYTVCPYWMESILPNLSTKFLTTIMGDFYPGKYNVFRKLRSSFFQQNQGFGFSEIIISIRINQMHLLFIEGVQKCANWTHLSLQLQGSVLYSLKWARKCRDVSFYQLNRCSKRPPSCEIKKSNQGLMFSGPFGANSRQYCITHQIFQPWARQ